jgi:molybdopterin-guanine dinucleotide biosynthesis protein A
MSSHQSVNRLGVSAVVLAGGMSRRLGRNKALEPIGGQPLIFRITERLAKIAEELVVVVNEAERATVLPLPPGAKVTVDRYPGKGSLGGLFTGLSAATQPWAVMVACDMPFLSVALLRHMLSLREGHDAVVPVVEERPEPLHALYSTRCLPFMERRLQADDLKIARFFDEVHVCYVPEAELRRLDPELQSFFNINTQEDVDRAVALAAQGR